MNRRSSIRICSLKMLAGIICIALASCKTTQKAAVDVKDLSYLYNPTKSSIKPRFSVFNESDEKSVLSVKLFASDLLFSEANPQGVPLAQILITVKLYNTTNGVTLADTTFLDADIVKEPSRLEYVYRLPMNVEHGQDYVAEVKLLDQLRTEVIQQFLTFNTRSYTNRYNFIARGNFRNNELFNPVVRVNEYVNLLYPLKTSDSLYISFYKPLQVPPYPPSMMLPDITIDYPSDTVIAFAYSDTLPLMFPKKGVYFCSVDREAEDGYTFFNFGETFPTMTDPAEMIEPLVYLASEEELSNMRSAPKPKVALDEFWIRCGGNIDKSRELIRIYYTRILYSNFYFTSYKEGWRTERGMIYTIYGPPDKVYKSSDGERWGYRKPVVKSSWGGGYHLEEDYLFFNFKFRENKFSDNDYFLSRSETLVTYWDKAVLSWRQGIVFRLDNPEDF